MIPILLLANLMNVFNSFYGTVYTATMHTSYIMRTTVVGAALCVVLTPALMVPLGTYGACVAFVLSQAAVFVLRARDSARYVSFDAGWGFLLPTILLLSIQALVAALRFDGWWVASAACLVAVSVIQSRRAYPEIKGAVRAVRGRSPRKER